MHPEAAKGEGWSSPPQPRWVGQATDTSFLCLAREGGGGRRAFVSSFFMSLVRSGRFRSGQVGTHKAHALTDTCLSFFPGFPVARGAGMPSCHPLSLLLLSLGRCPLPLPPRGQRGCGTATPARVRVSFLSRFPAPLPRSGQARGQGHVHALFSFPLSSFPPASLSLPVCSLSLSRSFSPSGEGFSSSFSRR